MLWLDHLTFGNGYGLATPYFDGRFYWLSGRLYTWIGGLGAQLQSFQWVHPKPGEVRRLAGLDYRPFQSTRRGLRVRVSWATRLPEDLGLAHASLRAIHAQLGETFPRYPAESGAADGAERVHSSLPPDEPNSSSPPPTNQEG